MRRSRQVTVSDVQVEAVLRQTAGKWRSVPPRPLKLILRLSFGAVKENLEWAKTQKDVMPAASQVEACAADLRDSEKVSRASLLSKRVSLLGKSQPFEGDRDRLKNWKVGPLLSGNPKLKTGRSHDAKGTTRDRSERHGGVCRWKRYSQRRTEPDVAESGRVGDADGRLRQHALLEAQADHRGQCRQAAGRLDLLDRRAARPRGRTAHHRQHDVRPHALPEQGLCSRPYQREQDRLEPTNRSRIRTSSR